MKGKKKLIGVSFAWSGIKYLIKTERNFQIHLIITLIVLCFSIYFKINTFEWLFVFLAICIVLVTEAINTTIEQLINYLQPNWHPQAKIIKDVGAGAVLLAAITSALIGTIIFIPKIYALF